MPSFMSRKDISNRMRRRNKEADFEIFFGDDLKCDPMAVGSHGRAAGITWMDYPITLNSVRWIAFTDTPGNWLTKIFRNATVIHKSVKYYISPRNKESMAGRVVSTRDLQTIMSDAKKTPAPWMGLMSNVRSLVELFHVISQNELPWIPKFIKDKGASESLRFHESIVENIGKEGARIVFFGHVMRMAGLLLLLMYLLYVLTVISIWLFELNLTLWSTDSYLLWIVIYIAASLVFVMIGSIYIRMRTDHAMRCMQNLCRETNQKLNNETENGLVRRYDILVSSERFSINYLMRRKPTSENVSLVTEGYRKPTWKDSLFRRVEVNFFLRYSEYPIEYHNYFQAERPTQPKGASFSSESPDSSGKEAVEREGVICNPFCESYTTLRALIGLPYRVYMSDDNIENHSDYAPHGALY